MFENSLEKSPSRGVFKPSIYRRMQLVKQAKEGSREFLNLAGSAHHAEIHIQGLEVATTAAEFVGLCAIFFPKA